MYILNVYSNLLKSRIITKTPLILSHIVTSLCNCKCKTCDIWKKSSEYKNDLSKEEIFKMLEDAREAGFIAYSAWGGEPLLRQDLPEILKHAKEQNLITSMITNGFLLKDRCSEVTPYLDYIIVSIDSNDDLHDKMRGVNGIREKAIEGINICKESKTRVIINSVISKLNLDKIDGLLRLSKELNVSITFEPMQIIKGYNENLKPSEEEIKKAFYKIIQSKKSGFRIGNSYQYLNNFYKQKDYTCHAPKVYITVDAHGNVISCLDKNWGNIKDKSFKKIFSGSEFKNFCKNAETCHICDVSCVIETSVAYSMNPMFFIDKFRNLL